MFIAVLSYPSLLGHDVLNESLQNINWRNVQYSVCIISFHYIHAEVQRLTSDSFIQQQFYFKQVLNHQRCIQLYNHDNKTIKRGVHKHKSFSSQISMMNFKLNFKTIKMLSVWLTFSDAQQCSITLNYLVQSFNTICAKRIVLRV